MKIINLEDGLVAFLICKKENKIILLLEVGIVLLKF